MVHGDQVVADPRMPLLISAFFDVSEVTAARFMEVLRAYTAALDWAAAVRRSSASSGSRDDGELMARLLRAAEQLRGDQQDPRFMLIDVAAATLCQQLGGDDGASTEGPLDAGGQQRRRDGGEDG